MNSTLLENALSPSLAPSKKPRPRCLHPRRSSLSSDKMSYAKNNPELKRGMSKRTSLTTPHIYQVSEEEKPHLIIRSQYDPHNHFRNLLQYRGTVTQLLVTSPLFWFINVLNVIVFVSWKYLAEDHKQRVLGQWHLKISYMQPMGSFVVFLVVFYTSNCFANYKDLFHFGCKLQHSISLFAVQLKSVLRSPGGYLEWQCVRHMISAQRIFYFEERVKVAEHHGYTVEDGPSKHPGEFSDWAKLDLVDAGLLRIEEAEMLGGFRGSKLLLLTSWSQTSFQEYGSSCPAFLKLSPPMQSQYLRHCMDTNTGVEQLLEQTRDTIHFGVPFVYHHIVHLIVLLYMVLLPFANVFVQEGIPSYWTLITYPAVSFVLFGVLEAADAMADPYGEDECDFNLNALMDSTYREVVEILGAEDEAKLEGIFRVAVLPPYLKTQASSNSPLPTSPRLPSPPSHGNEPPVSVALLQQSKPECLPTVPVSEFQLDITPLASASSLRTPPGSPPSIRPEPSAPPRTLSAVAHPLSCLPADVSLEIGTGEKREEVLLPESMKMVARLLRVLQEKEQAGFSERERQLKEGAQWLASHATNGSLELIDQNAPPYQPRRGSLPLIVDERRVWRGNGATEAQSSAAPMPDRVARTSRLSACRGGGGGDQREGRHEEDVERGLGKLRQGQGMSSRLPEHAMSGSTVGMASSRYVASRYMT